MRKLDRGVTSEVQTSHDAGRSSGRYNKELYTRTNRMSVEKPMNELRGFILEISHQWIERGHVIIPITLYDQSKEILAKLIENVREADTFAGNNFSNWKRDAELDLGTMWRDGDYPSADAFSNAFRIHFEITSVPIRVPSNILYNLIEEDKAADREDIRKMIEAEEAKNLLCVTESCAKRVFDATQHIIDGINHKQTLSKPGAKRGNNYRDSLIGNVWNLVQLLPDLNLANSSAIDDLHKALKANILAKLDVENITIVDKKKRMKVEVARMRENTSLENEMKKSATDIMKMAEAILPKADDNS
jgi:hypothetical protein